ncbi:hypothetical protein JOD65_002985 [Nocardioides cavernae]|uniref:MmcQ/YjbR family DNA-binding protein n=1 Tax=Nocardioides cavernae TaxID=1921566 RepID=UPI00195E811C|nr:MmcQ/YjbR family DNA-binding protein [Nocardioides cavernae]MBM7513441.1 hypothetical protein [Nocardioides cavernae]
MDAAAIEEHLAGLEGVRSRTDEGRTTWRVSGRLVARLEDAETLVVRSLPDDRERFAAEDPDAFYVTPAIEAHHKLLVHLPAADDDAVRRLLTAAWELQRG